MVPNVPYMSYNYNHNHMEYKNNSNIKKFNDIYFNMDTKNMITNNSNLSFISIIGGIIGGIVVGSGIYFIYKYKTKKQLKKNN